MSLISIVVPVYNAETYLSRCIDSILSQTYKNLEIILIDDGSTDSSQEICRIYRNKDNRVKVIHQKNKGVSAARNRGLFHAAGDYLGFVDADDWIEPDMYRTLYELINVYNSDIAICGHSIIYPTYKKISDCSDRIVELGREEFLKEVFVGSLKGFIWNKFFKKNLFKRLMFPEDIHYGEDMYIISEILLKDGIKSVYSSKPLYNYFQNDDSITNNIEKNFHSDGTFKLEIALNRIKYLFEGDKYATNLVNLAIAQSTLNVFRMILLDTNDDKNYKKRYEYLKRKLNINKKHFLQSKHNSIKQKILYLLVIISPSLFKLIYKYKNLIIKKI